MILKKLWNRATSIKGQERASICMVGSRIELDSITTPVYTVAAKVPSPKFKKHHHLSLSMPDIARTKPHSSHVIIGMFEMLALRLLSRPCVH